MSEYLAESRKIREEQDRAYAESLAADKAKEEAKVLMLIYLHPACDDVITPI